MTREIEARLKLSAVDRTAGAFKSVSGRMAAVDAKARALTAASSGFAAAAAARVAGVLAPAAGAMAAKRAFQDFAAVDRQITRIGITADASAEQVGEIRSRLFAIAQETATPISQVTAGLEDLVAQGKSLPEALAALPAVTRTAAASGAEVKDIAATAGALSDSLKISADRMQSAFDVMVAGGKAGKFEAKDMAQYISMIAPAAAAVGMKGEAGFKRLVAMLQIARAQTGDASSAATNLMNVFQKMETEETVKKFSKFGINLRKEMAKARKDGKDLTEVFIELSAKALKGDLSKIPQLFADAQFAAGMRALLSLRPEFRQLQSSLDNVDGTTVSDLAKVTGDAQSSVDKLANSWERFTVNLGRSVANTGFPVLLDKLSELMDRIAKINEAEDRKKGAGKDEYIRQSTAAGIDPKVSEDIWAMMTGGQTSEQAAAGKVADAKGSADRRARAAAELARLEKIKARYGTEPLPAILQAQYDAARATVDREPRDYGQRFAPVINRAQLAAGEAQRFRPAPEHFPMPRPRPEDGADAVAPAMAAMNAEIDLQGQVAVAKAQSIWDQIRAIFAQPITPNIQAPRLPALDTGRAIRGGDQAGGP